jgi:hypothetical protein
MNPSTLSLFHLLALAVELPVELRYSTCGKNLPEGSHVQTYVSHLVSAADPGCAGFTNGIQEHGDRHLEAEYREIQV